MPRQQSRNRRPRPSHSRRTTRRPSDRRPPTQRISASLWYDSGVPVLIAIPGSERHARGLGTRLGFPVLVPELRQFPDGELYVRIDGELADDAVIVGNASGENFLRLAFLA